MISVDEYQLIQIAARYRALEDAAEESDLHLAAHQQRFIDKQCVEVACTIGDIRQKLEAAVDQCRGDMVAMQEIIRANAERNRSETAKATT